MNRLPASLSGALIQGAVLAAALVVAGCDKPPPPPPKEPVTIGEKIKSTHDALGNVKGDPAQLGKAPEGMPTPHVGGHGTGPAVGMSKSQISQLPPTTAILKVDEQSFTRADLDRTMSQAAALSGIPPEMLDGEMKDAFEAPAYEKLIERAILGKEAKKRGLWPSDAEAKQSREEMIKSLPKGKSLDDVLKAMNTDEASFAADVAADVAIGKLLKALEAEMPAPPKEQIDKLYAANKAVFVVPDTAAAAHILIKIDRGAGPDVLKEKLKTATDIKNYLVGKSEKEFIDLVNEKSEDTATKGRGGDLGTFKRGDLFPELEKLAFSLKAGEIGGPVQTDRGFHVLRGGGVEKGRTIPEKEAKQIISDREKVKAFLQRVDDLTEELRKGAKIERLVEPMPSPLVDPTEKGSKVPSWKATGKNALPGMTSPH